ncbi:unnamed protein product [Candida verbasci]|uniref:Transfer RNA methyltransferase 82 n=1 Tax=Candida verbasci TaxID=1227364 RepID=A0A9W4U0A5_9ASCO|nr:unnamed protein product [Candida verbasci]
MKHPFQLLTSDKSGKYLFTSNQNVIQVFNFGDGNVIGEWKDETESGQLKTVKNDEKKGKAKFSQSISNYIRYLILDDSENYLIACADSDKSILIFKLDLNASNCLNLIKRQQIPKRPSSLAVQDSIVVVADKFGDVYSIPIDSEISDMDKLEPILGHVSMLLDVELVKSKNEKPFIITCDRDEHIRISNFPKSYVIKGYLMNHKNFVSKLFVPHFDSSLLISGGGDDYICLWNWYNENLMQKIDIRELVEEYLDDFHLPPERIRKEQEEEEGKLIKETSIAQISSVTIGEKSYVIILIEHTPVLLFFEFVNNNLKYFQILKFEDNIVNFAVTGDEIIVSLDSETLVKALKFDIEFKIDENEIVSRIIDQISINTDSNFQQLYPISSLRKRKENEF